MTMRRGRHMHMHALVQRRTARVTKHARLRVAFGDRFHNLRLFARELTSMPDAALPADPIAAE